MWQCARENPFPLRAIPRCHLRRTQKARERVTQLDGERDQSKGFFTSFLLGVVSCRVLPWRHIGSEHGVRSLFSRSGMHLDLSYNPCTLEHLLPLQFPDVLSPGGAESLVGWGCNEMVHPLSALDRVLLTVEGTQ